MIIFRLSVVGQLSLVLPMLLSLSKDFMLMMRRKLTMNVRILNELKILIFTRYFELLEIASSEKAL